MAGVTNKRIRYSDKFKLDAIDKVESGKSVSTVAKELGIENVKTLENWIRRKKIGQLLGNIKGKNNAGNVNARQECLLNILPRDSAGMTNDVILDRLQEEGYTIVEKTLQRDLKSLMERRLVDRAEPRGWYKTASKLALRLSELSVTDALSLNLLERFLRPILPAATTRQLKPVFEQAKKKLELESNDNKLARWAKQVAVVEPGLPVIPAEINKDSLEAVQQALLAAEMVKVDYAAPGKERRTYILNPLGLVQCGAITYFVATFSGQSDPILRLPMHRMKSAERTYDRATAPKGFSLKGFIGYSGPS